MSNNPIPEPPKMTAAKDLMQRPQPKPIHDSSEEPLNAVNEEATSDARVPTNANTPSVEEYSPESISETLSSEESEVIGEDEEAEPKRINFGPWEIIKHTGYFTVALWAVLTGTATGLAAHYLAPGDHTWILGTVLGFMTGLIGAVDNKTHLIKDRHTVITAILTVPLAIWVAFSLSSWNLLFGIISAAVVFGAFIFLVRRVNFGSGGDIKFAPIPAFALGVISPLIAVVWLFYAMVAALIILLVQKTNRTAFGTGMAISLPFAIASICGIYALVGMPYL